MAFICESLDVVSDAVVPLMAWAGVITSIIVALAYMLGEWTRNPKVTLWAKTEIFQVLVSVIFAGLLWITLQGFCSFNFASVAALFDLDVGAKGSFTLFEAAEGYFQDSGEYIKDIINVARYHLSVYNILQLRTLWVCEDSPVMAIIFCIFGSPLGMGSGGGTSVAPESGYSFAASAITMVFNTLLFSYLSILNYYFILNYIYSGFIFFFLPLGIFLRSMPYMRGLGSLMMALTLSFLFVYPTLLAIFYLDLITNKVLNPEPSATFQGYINKEGELEHVGDIGDVFDLELYDDLFGDHGGSVEFEILQLTGHAFLLGVFMPSLALLAAIGSVMYLNRFLGQEIDLSRIVQMV